LGLLVQGSPAQQPASQVSLDTSETLFTVLTAINACGYDSELDASDPVRSQVRAEVAKNIAASEELKASVAVMCQSYQEHQQPEASRNLAQFISLALYLNPPPTLSLKVKEADLSPDAAQVLSIVPLLQKFYADAGLHAIWERHLEAYAAFTDRYHEPLAKMLFDTEIYLKVPSSGYLGRGFTVYLDPMGAPAQTNARNYVSDYFVVISPGRNGALKMQQIRHTYLHYLLDPMALKYPEVTKRITPLLDSLKTAPMDESFKEDPGTLATECLIRAIEVRTAGNSKTPEEQRLQAIKASMEQGFILTQYFYDALVQFEKDNAGLRNVYGSMLAGIDVRKEERIAATTQFAASADPEILHLARPALEGKLLITAEQRLASGDVATAQKLAQQALDEKSEDAGRALFILAQVAVKNKDMEGARNYFEKALGVAHEPKVVVWSHIYLGRIFDLQEERDAALDHYRAALNAGEQLPEAKAAAQQGLQQPYEPPSHAQ
jgi:tetratricopeptide (TPR) repeat protein